MVATAVKAGVIDPAQAAAAAVEVVTRMEGQRLLLSELTAIGVPSYAPINAAAAFRLGSSTYICEVRSHLNGHGPEWVANQVLVYRENNRSRPWSRYEFAPDVNVGVHFDLHKYLRAHAWRALNQITRRSDLGSGVLADRLNGHGMVFDWVRADPWFLPRVTIQAAAAGSPERLVLTFGTNLAPMSAMLTAGGHLAYLQWTTFKRPDAQRWTMLRHPMKGA